MDEFVGNVTPAAGSGTDEEILNRRKMRYNCAQAVLLAFAEDAGLEKDVNRIVARTEKEIKAGSIVTVGERVLKHAVAGFGGGIGRTHDEGTCGALTGAVAGLGILLYADDERTSELARELFLHFKKELGTLQCARLKSPEQRVSCIQCCLVAGRKLREIIERESQRRDENPQSEE